MTGADSEPNQYAYFALDRRPAPGSPSLSVVAPVHDEAGGLRALVDEIAAALADRDAEIIFVDDGSTDETAAVLKAAQADMPRLRVIRHGRKVGKSRAVHTGVLAAGASVIATLDGDGQNDPADIPRLIDQLNAADGAIAMVSGRRAVRKDTTRKRIASGVANAVRRRILRDGAVDTGCGLKVFLRGAYLRLPYFDNMHRYMPALMRREGFAVAFSEVNDRPRAYGRSKYTNLGRFFVGIVDLWGVCWLMARARKPISIRETRD